MLLVHSRYRVQDAIYISIPLFALFHWNAYIKIRALIPWGKSQIPIPSKYLDDHTMALISRLWTRTLNSSNSTEAHICSFLFSLLSRPRRHTTPKTFWHDDHGVLFSTSLTQKLNIWIHQILDEPQKPRIKAMPSLSMPALLSTTKGGIPK